MGIPQTDNPKVIEHIKAQQYDEKRRMYHCGCILAKDGTFMLCQWHDGYDEGLAEAAEQETELAEAIQWRDWQTVEMLMDEQGDTSWNAWGVYIHKVEMERRADEAAKQRARDEAIIRACHQMMWGEWCCDECRLAAHEDIDFDAIIAAAEQGEQQ